MCDIVGFVKNFISRVVQSFRVADILVGFRPGLSIRSVHIVYEYFASKPKSFKKQGIEEMAIIDNDGEYI